MKESLERPRGNESYNGNRYGELQNRGWGSGVGLGYRQTPLVMINAVSGN